MSVRRMKYRYSIYNRTICRARRDSDDKLICERYNVKYDEWIRDASAALCYTAGAKMSERRALAFLSGYKSPVLASNNAYNNLLHFCMEMATRALQRKPATTQ